MVLASRRWDLAWVAGALLSPARSCGLVVGKAREILPSLSNSIKVLGAAF